MQRMLLILVTFLFGGALAVAHGDAMHVRGTITKVSGNAVTIQTSDKPSKAVTFTVADHTDIDKGSANASLKDLTVGSRVVVELPKGKTEAESIKIGSPAAERQPRGPATHAHKG